MRIIKRQRRLRTSTQIRRLVHETDINSCDLIYPVFVVDGKNVKEEISSMPGVYRFSTDMLVLELAEVVSLKIPGILLFGVTDKKDEMGTVAYSDDGIVQTALRAVKAAYPELLLIADVCMCEYTSHGHCGVVCDGRIDNDKSVELIVKSAMSFAKAGADIIAPSDMMDGRVLAIRSALDEAGYEDKAIMAYSAKYSSAFYGPFRDAANSAPQFGDRKSYQMDYCNFNEAMREIELDIEEGADIVIVKPALAYLDVIRGASDRFNVPIAAYNVSGEYSMVKAAAKMGWLDEKKVIVEMITAIKRSGAKIIITYFAKDIARWMKEDRA